MTTKLIFFFLLSLEYKVALTEWNKKNMAPPSYRTVITRWHQSSRHPLQSFQQYCTKLSRHNLLLNTTSIINVLISHYEMRERFVAKDCCGMTHCQQPKVITYLDWFAWDAWMWNAVWSKWNRNCGLASIVFYCTACQHVNVTVLHA